MESSTLSALALWTGLNLILMLMLALNVSRLRILSLKSTMDPDALNKAVRTHGNNIEYVPFGLLAILILALLGYSNVWLHVLGGVLFLSRVLHAIGMQQALKGGPPPARALGNLGTWGVLLVAGVALFVEGLQGL